MQNYIVDGSEMELKHNNFNAEIVLARKFNLAKHFLGKIVKIA